MEKLLRAKRRLAQNSKKGFTLVELIVVIVIIAILVAAILPAVIGAIDQANIVADQADARTVFTAASVAMVEDGVVLTELPNAGVVIGFISMASQMPEAMTFEVFVSDDDGMPEGVRWVSGRSGAGYIGDVGDIGDGDITDIRPANPID